MAKFFSKILEKMNFNDDFDDEDLDYEEEVVKPRRSKREEKEYIDRAAGEDELSNQNNTFISSTQIPKKERVAKMDRASNKVVPMRTIAKGLEVCILKPTTFEESQEISDLLLSGKATVINLEGFDDKIAQRIMDFVSGCVYAINGRLHRISNSIFIVSPDNVDISGDYLDLIKNNGFAPPTFDNLF